MRGYHAEKNKLEGYELGKIDSYYFTPENKKNEMIKYQAVKGPFFSREFPVSWRDIDKGFALWLHVLLKVRKKYDSKEGSKSLVSSLS